MLHQECERPLTPPFIFILALLIKQFNKPAFKNTDWDFFYKDKDPQDVLRIIKIFWNTQNLFDEKSATYKQNKML